MMVNSTQDKVTLPPQSVAIIGSGFSGLGMAIRLKQLGIEDFVLLEKADALGGTWRDNTYPGCACDVESHLYSFSFAPNPRWSRMFSGQAEIWEYLKDCADRFGLGPHLKLNHEVKGVTWNETKQQWRIVTSQGSFDARVIIGATGALSEPKFPSIKGLETFRGKVMHSARWDHGYDLKGKRVAVIGTGASAIQFVPEVQPQVAKLYLFQRTPPWVVPSLDRPLTPREHWLMERLPLVQKFWRLKIYVTRELLGLAFRHPRWMSTLEKIAIRHMARAIKDPELRRKLTPNYRIGCKRILISNKYYPALTRPNVEVVTDAIDEIREHAVVTKDGREHEVDAILLGTGFHVTDTTFARCIEGPEGRRLSQVWNDSPRGHLGTTVAGFPNLFVLLGPNTGLGHNSVVLMIESQIQHVVGALEFLRRKGAAQIEPKLEAQDAFNASVEDKMRRTVWVTGGCASWYLDHTGKNSTLWPSSVGSFHRRVKKFNPSEYRIEGKVETGAWS